MASWRSFSVKRSLRHQAPPWHSTSAGNGPSPRGLNTRASSGLSPWRRYSTSSTSNSCVLTRFWHPGLRSSWRATSSRDRAGGHHSRTAAAPATRLNVPRRVVQALALHPAAHMRSGSARRSDNDRRRPMAGKHHQDPLAATAASSTATCACRPAGTARCRPIVLASAVHGVDKDIRDLADEFAAHGYIAAAPDLFWRSIPGPLAARRQAHGASARSRGSRRSRPAKPTWRTRWPRCASCRSSTAAPRRWASATAAPTRSSGRSGSATTPASPATARSMLDFIEELDGVTAAGLHHLGRPGPRGAGRGAGGLSRRAGAHEERRGAHLPGRAARLHDAGEREGVPSARRATSPWRARSRSSTGCARGRAAEAAAGVVTGQ